jgi:hypothetical protein
VLLAAVTVFFMSGGKNLSQAQADKGATTETAAAAAGA